MISIDQSYEMGLSPYQFYELEREEVKMLIREHGAEYHTFSRSGEPGVLTNAIPILHGFILTEELEIVCPERYVKSE